MARRALHPTLAHQRVKRRTQCQRLVVTVGKVRHGQAHQRIDRPAVQAPVQEGQLQRLACRAIAGGSAFGRVEVVVQRLGRTEIQQRDADTRREQHAGPGAVAEVWGIVLRTQLKFPIGRKRQADHKHQVGSDDHHVVPAKAFRQPGLCDTEQAPGLLRGDDQNGGQQ